MCWRGGFFLFRSLLLGYLELPLYQPLALPLDLGPRGHVTVVHVGELEGLCKGAGGAGGSRARSPSAPRGSPDPELSPGVRSPQGQLYQRRIFLTFCVPDALAFGVSHSRGERQTRAHPALPEPTLDHLCLTHTPSLNHPGPGARQLGTAPVPQTCWNYLNGQILSGVPPALPFPQKLQ